MKNISKSILSIAAAVTVVGASLSPALVSAWGDSANGRASYTISEINAGKLGDTITFNSISDGKIGDEKNFVGAIETSKIDWSNTGSSNLVWKADSIEVKDGETYTIRLYVHNNSPRGTDAVAKDVKTTFSLPTTVSNSQTIIGYLDSSNANPGRYWDEVTLTSDDDFYLEYVEGSAKYTNAKMGTVALSDNIITSGVSVGYESLNGEIPGCYEYDGVATINVKVHKSVSAKLSKTVRLKGTKTWSESVTANIGDEVEYQIEYVNLLSETVKDVMIRDVLPTNMEYVADSTYLYNANYQKGVQLKDNTVTTSGINIGSYTANGNAYVRFTAKVVDKTLACGSNQLVNWASSTVNSKVTKDDASVMVEKSGDVCKETPTPDPTPDPEPEPTPDPEPTPEVIVNTGAGTIVSGAIGAGSVVTMLGYYIASRKKLM